MKLAQLEAWAHQAIDGLIKDGRKEDDLVEFKMTWIDADKAARRIAAHANKAHGDPILWIIGVDEKNRKVVGVGQTEDMATWWPKVKSTFDDAIPEMQHAYFLRDGQQLVLMAFETDRAPYVVRCSGSPDREVPWRDGTQLISARREHLLRMLAPNTSIPEMDLLSAQLNRGLRGILQLSGELYATPRTRERVCFPYHKTRGALRLPDGVELVMYVDEFGPRPGPGVSRSANSPVSYGEAILDGPARLRFLASHPTMPGPNLPDWLEFELLFGVAGAERTALVKGSLCVEAPNTTWSLREAPFR